VQLLDGEGKPAPAKIVMILPVDSAKWRFAIDSAQAITDATGIVPFAGAPGDYLVIVADQDESWPPSQAWIGARAQTARRIKLEPGDNKSITIPLNP